jgi:hypothetical protein
VPGAWIREKQADLEAEKRLVVEEFVISAVLARN